MKKTLFGTALAATMVLATTAFAAEFKMGTGGENGNYFGMGNDIAAYCPDLGTDHNGRQFTLAVENSGGSLDNLVGLTNKKFALGIVQQDALQYMARRDQNRVNQNRLKVLTGMHAETVHLLIPKGYQPEDTGSGGLWGSLKGKLGIGDDSDAPIDVNLLQGQRVGAWGGSLVSAQALSLFLDLGLDVVELDADARVNPNIPLVLVGGQPYKPVEEYLDTGNWHLVGIDATTIQAKAPFYMPMSANYTVNGRLQDIPTVGVRAVLVGKSFRREAANAPMSYLATCIDESLADLADDPTTNPNWGSVYEFEQAGNQINWQYFPLNTR